MTTAGVPSGGLIARVSRFVRSGPSRHLVGGGFARIVVLGALVWGLIAVWARGATAAELFTVDGGGQVVKAANSRASLQRTPPTVEPEDPTAPHRDPDALRYLLVDSEGRLPALVDITSVDTTGRVLDRLDDVPLVAVPCPAPIAADRSCAVTAPIRAVIDDIDRQHPLIARRSLRARLGGAIVLGAGPATLGRVRIAGPRQTEVGAIDRYRARLRFVFVRLAPGGGLPVGGDEDGAREIAARLVDRTSALWSACGVDFGPPTQTAVELVDPPPPALLAIGCGHGLRASGGTIRFLAGRQRFEVPTVAGQTPAETARRVAAALRAAGLAPELFDNPRMAAAAGASTDLFVRDAAGQPVALAPLDGPVSDDATQVACIGNVHLEDGLQHFSDVDAAVGTLEERTLLRAIDDGDPTTIDVVLIPAFARGGRIGESFIAADGGTLPNLVVIDRAGIHGGGASFTLAHELGHVLLDEPGHPDDYGVDLPTRLMDADASDGTAFGPRRLSLDECARAVRQSGPDAPVTMLTPWPLEPLGAPKDAPSP